MIHSARSAALIMFLVALLGWALGPTAGAQQPVARTAVRVFLPFGPEGIGSGLTVTSRLSGECFSRSLASPGRPDAWRCTSGNQILDPCLEGFGQAALVCAQAPWSSEVALLTPSKPLPQSGGPRELDLTALPWALALANGARCVLLTGATSGLVGLRINYGCVGGKAYVFGEVDRSLPEWQVFFTDGQGSVAERVAVAVAWY